MKVLIYKTRKEKNVSLRQLEKMTGISKATLNFIENERFSCYILVKGKNKLNWGTYTNEKR